MKPTRVVRRARKKAEDADVPEVSEVEEAPTETPEPAPPRKSPVSEAVIDADALEALASMDGDDFARAMAGLAPSPSRQRLSPGDEVEGRVVGFSDSDAFVDVGGKAEATIALEDLGEVEVGDTIQATVLQVGGRGLRLGKRLRGGEAREHLDAALASGVPLEGRVVERNKGGYVVEVGSLRGFCPVSRIDPRPGVDLDAWIGRTLSFRVVELKGRDVVLDRRVLEEEARAEKAESLWRELAQGQKRQGVVDGVQDFGVFVDLGGVRGLVPRSELGEQSLRPGEEVEVRVTSVDHARGRVGLSLAGERPVAASPEVHMGSMAAAFEKARKKR